jgi:hypothetical protein
MLKNLEFGAVAVLPRRPTAAELVEAQLLITTRRNSGCRERMSDRLLAVAVAIVALDAGLNQYGAASAWLRVAGLTGTFEKKQLVAAVALVAAARRLRAKNAEAARAATHADLEAPRRLRRSVHTDGAWAAWQLDDLRLESASPEPSSLEPSDAWTRPFVWSAARPHRYAHC